MFAVLLYHGIADGSPSARAMDATDREYVLARAQFESHVAYLAARPASSVPVVVSFDDGDLSGYTVAAPILERHGLRGEFFVVTRWIGQPGFMTADQVRDLAGRGHGVHSHSRTHPRLSSLPLAQIDDEVIGSKTDLESILGREVTQFSIPGGAYDARVLDAARRAGYRAVFNSVEGYNDERRGDLVRRRFTPRSYSEVAMLRAICEHPWRTRGGLVVKRALLAGARGLLGETGYGRLRETVISRRRAAE